MHILLRPPAETLREGWGDCDDKTIAQALMLNRVFPNSTRIVLVDAGVVGYEYLQFDTNMLDEFGWVYTDQQLEVATGLIASHYNVGRSYIEKILESGTATDVRFDYYSNETNPAFWISLDSTTDFPGYRRTQLDGMRIISIVYTQSWVICQIMMDQPTSLNLNP